MRRTAPSADQPALFELPGSCTTDQRAADRRTCRAYLKQWVHSFKSNIDQPEVSFDEFEAASARLSQENSCR